MEDFVALASGAGITVIADVCSIPYSRRVPEFNREDIASAVKRRGIAYVGLATASACVRTLSVSSGWRRPLCPTGGEREIRQWDRLGHSWNEMLSSGADVS